MPLFTQPVADPEPDAPPVRRWGAPLSEHGDPSRTNLPYPHGGGKGSLRHRVQARLGTRPTRGAGADAAQLVRPGQPFDLEAAAPMTYEGRRFLFNPRTRALILGDAGSDNAGEFSHADAYDTAMGPAPSDDRGRKLFWREHDQFALHGFVKRHPNGRLQITVSRMVGNEQFDFDNFSEDAIQGATDELVSRAVAAGAPPDTRLVIWGFKEQTLSSAYPELFKRKRAA